MTDELSQRRMRYLVVRCPHCGCPPMLRVSEIVTDAVQGFNPKAAALTYTCHRRICGKPYDVPFQALQQARADRFDRAA